MTVIVSYEYACSHPALALRSRGLPVAEPLSVRIRSPEISSHTVGFSCSRRKEKKKGRKEITLRTLNAMRQML